MSSNLKSRTFSKKFKDGEIVCFTTYFPPHVVEKFIDDWSYNHAGLIDIRLDYEHEKLVKERKSKKHRLTNIFQ